MINMIVASWEHLSDWEHHSDCGFVSRNFLLTSNCTPPKIWISWLMLTLCTRRIVWRMCDQPCKSVWMELWEWENEVVSQPCDALPSRLNWPLIPLALSLSYAEFSLIQSIVECKLDPLAGCVLIWKGLGKKKNQVKSLNGFDWWGSLLTVLLRLANNMQESQTIVSKVMLVSSSFCCWYACWIHETGTRAHPQSQCWDKEGRIPAERHVILMQYSPTV